MVQHAFSQAQKQVQSSTPIASGILHSKCDKCRKKMPALQRSAVSPASETLPLIVHDVLRSPGQPLDAATRAFMEPRFEHDFSRIPVKSKQPLNIQTRLEVSSPGDACEQEAERHASQIMNMQESSQQSTRLYGEIHHDGKAEKLGQKHRLLQMRAYQPIGTQGISAPLVVHEALRSPGQALDGPERGFFEARFPHDFSQVRLHTDALAAQSAQAVNALAYTVGNHIAFGENQYQPHTYAGHHLLAHELIHVLQQNETGMAENMIHRSVKPNSNCPANVHNAPSDPIAALQNIDARAQLMALGCRHLLFLESLIFDDPTFGPSETFNAYRDWFGTPEQTSTGRWRSRFRTATFATENEATKHEMQGFSERFQIIHDWLSGQIRYVCPGTSIYTIPGCSSGQCSAQAESCSAGSRTIGICPGFWTGCNDDGKASLLIHEAIHARFHYQGHPTSPISSRRYNPACYKGFVDTIYNTGCLPLECNAIMHFRPFTP